MRHSDVNSLLSDGVSRRFSRRHVLGLAAGLAASTQFTALPAQEANSLAPNGLTAKSVYAFDSTSNVLLYANNPDERRPVGSLAKITTALVVVETLDDLTEQVLVDESDTVNIEVFSNMQLNAGDTLTVSLLLYGTLIPSGNDGAKALARYVGSKLSGSDDPDVARDAFVARMNEFAKEHGLTNTQFQNPDGTDERDAFSSAHDVAILFSLLMQHDKLREIVGTPIYQGTSSGPEQRQYTEDTTNDLLNTEGVIGGKTGTTEDAGGCVTLAREVAGGNIVIISIVGADVEYTAEGYIDEPSDMRWDDARAVISQMDEQLSWAEPPDDSAFPGLEEAMNVWEIETRDQAAVPLRLGDEQSMYQLVLSAPVAAGEQAGQVDLFYGEIQTGSFPVYQAG